ncbi:MAG: hypothetical protein GY852_11350, partial [bacterium]|nr:hypothetical protein [bacterium]
SSTAKDVSEREFIPKLSVLLADIKEKGPNRSAAMRDLKKFASRYETEELWGAANALIEVIKNKDDASFDRIEAVDTMVSVLNAVRGKMVKKERGGITWSAEPQIPVQEALPSIHPGSVLHAAEEEIAAENNSFARMEIVREESAIMLMNSIALAEMFDNTDVAKAIREGILKMDSPHAKKIMSRAALEEKPVVVAEEPAAKPGDKLSLAAIFDTDKDETDFSGVG